MSKVQLLAALTTLGTAAPAFCAVDTADITSAITDAGTAGAAIASAVVVMLVGIKVFKWIRRGL